MAKEYPVPGLLIHENVFLRNCMTHVLQGSKYLDLNEKPDLKLALQNSKEINISLYSEFNTGLQRSFNNTCIPIDMSKNIKALNGEPSINKVKQETGLYYNAPKKLIDLVIDNNQEDIKLYKLISRNLKYEF